MHTIGIYDFLTGHSSLQPITPQQQQALIAEANATADFELAMASFSRYETTVTSQVLIDLWHRVEQARFAAGWPQQEPPQCIP